jgi:mediator of RNA polymerase II transcription subunit 17
LTNVEFSVPSLQAPSVEICWQQKLENAQNVLFCKELFSNLAREAVQLQLPIPTLVIGNQIIVTLFPGIQLIIALCHSTVKSKRTVCEDVKPQLTPKNHNHVLEHSLHQLLRETHYKALHQPMPHPVTATLGINRKRYFAGPEAIDKQTLIESCKNETILEQIVAQSQHIVLRNRTMRLIDELAAELSDPLLVAHWLTLSSPFQSSVRLNISSYGYENLCRSPVVIHIGTRSIKAICRDGRKFNLSYESNELRCLLLSQISQHQAFATQALAKMMGWKVLTFTTNCGIGPVEKIGTASSLVLCSPNGKR